MRAVQTPQVWDAAREGLRIVPGPMESPNADFSTVSPTWDIAQGGFLSILYRISRYAVNIDGVVTVITYRTDTPTNNNQSRAIVPDDAILIPSVYVQFTGGAVTPIRTSLLLLDGTATYTVDAADIATPGVHVFRGPDIVPPRVDLRIIIGAGGVGDLAEVHIYSRFATEGRAIP